MKACSGILPEVVVKLCNLFFIVDSAPPSNLRLRRVGTQIEASWTAPSNRVVDYRVFINDENVNSDGTIVASVLTTYIIPNITLGFETNVSVHVRATSNHYWSTVVSSSFLYYGMLRFNESTGVEIVSFSFQILNVKFLTSCTQFFFRKFFTSCL